ncbi:facilitated trehalose transporter Tret1-like isoform X1 [Bombyx mori]|uniref:Major facilitator superfamily (MFS) profile domain-containing protein n=2 Tax=Bombyx mori TaxID=7091 RepID=A0A8R2C919_BOMMO|nr:facilitated trehalose transporter Tret1-like isoform X1 [Bombyx mori]
MNIVLTKMMWKNGTRINQYLFAILITIPLLSFGMIQGWLSPMIASLQSPGGPSPEPYNSNDISWVTSVTYISAIILGAPMGHLTDKYGRKVMTLATTLSLIIYWQIKLLCLEPWALIMARAIAGIPCSACYIVLPIYLKEISDIDLRGALGSLLILNRNIGYLASYVGADLLAVSTMLWLGLMVPVIVFFIFLIMPETPEFLVKQGKVDEAKTVLAWLRGVSVVDRAVEQDIDNIVSVEKQTKIDAKSVWGTILHDRPTFKAFIITLVIKITQQFDGYLIVLIYAGFVFKKASDSVTIPLTPNKQVMMIGVLQLLGSILATCIVEKTGRKLLLVSTSFTVGVGMVALSAWFYMTSLGFWLPGWVPVVAMCVCIFADAAGFQPISYIIITDLFTFQLRGTVSSFTNICAKISNFIQMKWFTDICNLVGIHWTFLFFGVVSFGACIYTMVRFPETRQKTVAEIYSKLSGNDEEKDENKTEVIP